MDERSPAPQRVRTDSFACGRTNPWGTTAAKLSRQHELNTFGYGSARKLRMRVLSPPPSLYMFVDISPI